MFDLEKAIHEWQRQMSSEGVSASVLLDELESHLREEVETKIRSGLDAQRAFENAVQEIGRPDMIKNEFKKIGAIGRVTEWLMIGVCAAFVALILFLGSATVVLCFTNLGDRLMAAAAMAAALAVSFTWRRAIPFLPVVGTRWKRLAVGPVCMAVGFGAGSLYVGLMEVSGQGLQASMLWAVFIIAVFSCAGIGLGMSQKEREKLKLGRSK